MTMRQSAGGAGNIDEPERGQDEQQVRDPAGRTEPYVEGPTGPAPLATELRGDPGADGERRSEGGAAAGAIAGTAVAGPIGGVVGGLAGGAIGSASIDEPGRDPRNDLGDHGDETDTAEPADRRDRSR
jgi:hypothetical protein